MLPRLINACKANNVPLEIKALTPLLLGTYSKEKLRNLINNAQEHKESIQ